MCYKPPQNRSMCYSWPSLLTRTHFAPSAPLPPFFFGCCCPSDSFFPWGLHSMLCLLNTTSSFFLICYHTSNLSPQIFILRYVWAVNVFCCFKAFTNSFSLSLINFTVFRVALLSLFHIILSCTKYLVLIVQSTR